METKIKLPHIPRGIFYNKAPEEIIKIIGDAWESKELSDTKGFIEVKPQFITKKEFRIIEVHFKDGSYQEFHLSFNEFKEYKYLLKTKLGV